MVLLHLTFYIKKYFFLQISEPKLQLNGGNQTRNVRYNTDHFRTGPIAQQTDRRIARQYGQTSQLSIDRYELQLLTEALPNTY